MVLTRIRCQDTELVLKSLNQIVEVGVQSVCDAISLGEGALSAQERNHRTWCAAMLNKLPLTCKALFEQAKQDKRYAAVMFYERTRLGAASSGHFLEGLAGGLPVFSGQTALQLPDADLAKLRLRDVVADRIKTVSSLELMANQSPRFESLVEEFTLEDLPDGLPNRVHIFVSRMRGICQGLNRVKPDGHFKQCKNCECNRRFYMGAPTELGVETSAAGRSADPMDCYWDAAAGEPEVGHSQREFCTWSCCQQWQWQLSQALPNRAPSLMIADYQCRKEGRARVPEALRRCGKRNEAAARHLRCIEKEGRSFPAVKNSDLRAQRRRVVRMLNVDLGMLYAASMMAESRSLASNKVLPGASEGWRSRPMFYVKAIKSVLAVYKKHHVGCNVVSNMLVHEPFLLKLKQRASAIF